MATVTQAYRFALDPTPAQERKLASHAGAARFAYNWGLARVKACLTAREWERAILGGPVTETPWSLPALRREWNREKDRVAPWWVENSKEAYNSGLDGLARALDAWSQSRRGTRRGRRVGFPRFKRRGRARESWRITTGSFGVSGPTRIQLPRVGHVRTHEPTSKLARKIAAGQARVFAATVSRAGGRWYCSLTVAAERHDAAPARPASTVGVDVGVRHLAVVSGGESPIVNPRALEQARRALRRLARKADRQRRANNPGCYRPDGTAITGRRPARRSARQHATEARLGRAHARVANIRRDTLHKLTTRLAATHGTVVVERLNAAGLCRSGSRGLRRALHDAALAEIRRQLAYKTAWRGGALTEAPTFYPSSKTCSGCGQVKAKLALSERTYRCEHCGLVIDRDTNAARNLAALATMIAPSGGETQNARSPTEVRPGPAGHTVDREAGTAPAADQTGTAPEQSEAA